MTQITKMKCPSCQVQFSAPAPECPNCGLTLAQLDRKFGIVPHFARYLTDRSRELTEREVEKLRASLRLFERKFPQLLFSVQIVGLGTDVSISEYAFWMINRARFSALNAIGPKNFELLLIVDPDGEAAALIAGYGLEPYISEEELQAALAAAVNDFRLGDFALGIRECIEFVIQRLRDISVRFEEKKSPLAIAPDTQ
jgi:uncharacterized membrane protein YgcG